jgi:hypothetical protein
MARRDGLAQKMEGRDGTGIEPRGRELAYDPVRKRLGRRAARQVPLGTTVAAQLVLPRPEPFTAVGLWYEDFTQTTDEEVHALLDASDPIAATAARKGGRG